MKVFMDSLAQLERVMTHTRDRHGVLSTNVANVDTPGFRAQDLEGPSFESKLGLALEKTDSRHVDGGGSVGGASSVEISDDRTPRGDGNTVSLETQMAKLEENRVRFGAASTVVSRRLALLRYVVTDGNG